MRHVKERFLCPQRCRIELRMPLPVALISATEIMGRGFVSESAQIIEVLKRTLKSRGITYRDLARRIGLSEASVKRIFSAETFTLERLETICMAMGMSMSEIVRMASESLSYRRVVAGLGAIAVPQIGAVVARICGIRRTGPAFAGEEQAQRGAAAGLPALGVLHVRRPHPPRASGEARHPLMGSIQPPLMR